MTTLLSEVTPLFKDGNVVGIKTTEIHTMDPFNPHARTSPFDGGTQLADPAQSMRDINRPHIGVTPQQHMPECVLKVGDVVMFKTREGPKMVVSLISGYNPLTQDHSVSVRWFNNTGDMKQEVIASSLLVKEPQEGPPEKSPRATYKPGK